MTNSIKAVLFDLDGTLVDTAPDLAQALNQLRQNHDLSILPLEKIRPYASHGTRGLLEIGFNITPQAENFSNIRTELLNIYDQVMLQKSELFPKMDQVIAWLEKNHLQWGIVTSKPRYFSEKLLAHLNLSKRIACLVAGDDVKNPKPSAEPLLRACDLLKLSQYQTIYIGDAERDIQSAKNANMFSIAALYGYIKPDENPNNWNADFYINSADDLLNWLSTK